ncbi:MAG: IS110 family transposase [Candidatus Bruticola sp.]
MNFTQNQRINQVSEQTLVIGVDIASETNYARAFNWRGLEQGKVFKFYNNLEGFQAFKEWANQVMVSSNLSDLLVAAEPTGHYWFGLADYLKGEGIKLVLVNPFHVSRAKELDDNHPSKTDAKDPKTIAKLTIEGRYMEPYIPEGIYADIRILYNCRQKVVKAMVSLDNQIQRWFKIYFPEYLEVFGNISGQGSMVVLERAVLPEDIISLGVDGINKLWREKKLRAVGLKRAKSLYEAAVASIGRKEGAVGARAEFRMLWEDYTHKLEQMEKLNKELVSLLHKVPQAEELLKIKGIGVVSVAGFFAEVGDLRRFESPKQIQKLAGLAIRENSSGKHKGQTSISKRGRSRLRAVLFAAAMALVAKNSAFRNIHQYYIGRQQNPLKKKQSIVAVCCKLIRVIYAICKHKRAYDEAKMLKDIRREQVAA